MRGDDAAIPVQGGHDPAADAAELLRNYPQWAIWLPAQGRDWTAVRPSSSRPPGPGLPMAWVHADTSAELAGRMRSVNEQISGGCWPAGGSGSPQVP